MCTHTQAASTLSLMGYPGMMGTMFVWMVLGMLLFAAIVVGVVLLFVRAARTATRSSLPPIPYAPYERGQRENTLVPDAHPSDQVQQDRPPASSFYEQPHAQYPEMQQPR